ncbi:MAG: polyprenyl diphosphate synthase [Candidatus Saccharibacteria bacterium]|nr:polyprenyl diphosphate synthase [Candidatus Saccharibacteria bacterium]
MQHNKQATQPTHIGLILDGNRRWAKAQGLSTLDGHRKGYANLKTIAKHALKLEGLRYLTVFVFSTENWKRSEEEVGYLMDLALWVANNEVKELHKENIRVRFLGTKDKLDKKLLDAIEKAEELTINNTAGTVGLCFNYGGQQEITEAVRQANEAGEDMRALEPATLEKYLYAPDIPPVDMIIRTSGEQRISNFMLWRAAYAELYFADKHWPDFDTDDFDAAIEDYKNRQRRFGQ